MKIYAKFPEDAGVYAYPWFENISQQVKETVGLMAADGSYDPYEWSDLLPFPFFFQEDTHARGISCDEGGRNVCLLVEPMYMLLFEWEPEDLNEEYDDSEGFPVGPDGKLKTDIWDGLLKEAGLSSIDDAVIPEGYIYLGTYYYGQEEPLTLPGLVLCDDEDLGDDKGWILDDCMTAGKKSKK